MRTVVLTSGKWGGDFLALLNAHRAGLLPDIDFSALISTAGQSASLERAREEGIATHQVSRQALGRDGLDKAITAILQQRQPELICLCGYRYLLPDNIIQTYSGRILNSHPSLLPAFPGLVSKEEMIASGARMLGATVHYVDTGIDTGPQIIQAAFANPGAEDLEQAFARYRTVQDILYIQAVRWASGATAAPSATTACYLDEVLYSPALDTGLLATWPEHVNRS